MELVAKQKLTVSPLPKVWRGTLTYQTWGIYIVIFIEDDHISPICMHDLNNTVYVGLKDLYEQSRERCDEFLDGRPQDIFGERFDDPSC